MCEKKPQTTNRESISVVPICVGGALVGVGAVRVDIALVRRGGRGWQRQEQEQADGRADWAQCKGRVEVVKVHKRDVFRSFDGTLFWWRRLRDLFQPPTIYPSGPPFPSPTRPL